MVYLLDTNAISGLMKADPPWERWLGMLEPTDRIITCSIVRGEILFGISRLPLGKRRTELEQAGRTFLDAFHCEPIPAEAADIYATIKLARQRKGLALDENDLWIAATAIALNATLASRDADFAGIDGLVVVSPK